MPRLTRVWIKTALGYLSAALLLELVLAGGGSPQFVEWRPVTVHLLTVGWLTQLIFGVAWWLFPLRPSVHPRGNVRTAWAVYGLLNAGLLLRALAEPFPALPLESQPALLILAGALQALAVGVFAAQLWPRVRGPRRRGG